MLNLLGMPKIRKMHLQAGTKVFDVLDRIGTQMVGKRPIAGIMDEWVMLSEKIAQFIHNKSTFLVVANTEALVINLVRRVINTLTEYHLSIHGLIINKAIEETDSLSLATMRFLQMRHIEEIKKLAERRRESTLSFSLAEIKGLKRLQDLGEKLVADLGL